MSTQVELEKDAIKDTEQAETDRRTPLTLANDGSGEFTDCSVTWDAEGNLSAPKS
jgi:hypothetical protein